MAMSAEYRLKFATFHCELVTSPYEWNILDRDDKPIQREA